MKIFGREPAAWLGLVAILIKLFSAFVIAVGPDVQAWINAAAAAAMGLAVAYLTKDGVIAAILGFAQSAIALAVGLGAGLDTTEQALLLSALSMAIAGYDRTQVTAPVPANAAKPTAVTPS